MDIRNASIFTQMHADAIPNADRAGLSAPDDVADRILERAFTATVPLDQKLRDFRCFRAFGHPARAVCHEAYAAATAHGLRLHDTAVTLRRFGQD
jgi:hypothetical protein